MSGERAGAHPAVGPSGPSDLDSATASVDGESVDRALAARCAWKRRATALCACARTGSWRARDFDYNPQRSTSGQYGQLLWHLMKGLKQFFF